ncbi:FkbM family methyltransferase [Nitrosococcus wardiae]|uniref:Methyltransferase FkbM domain-containing protein n=1 Tax=Nitrosococcus wardiae TaxID=1814290 RepID=A0A4P7BWG1_9GAMM|nr:FkbM family methyltransferase [Nitrosococcus wardiae]QBQ54418.1 hypothetical protein E3U44_07780 [Nitrosococcus wardiae]
MNRLKKFLKGRPLRWVFWHPHQGLWNWDLVRIVSKVLPIDLIRKFIIGSIIFLDTSVLWIRAFARRIRKLGLASLFIKEKLPTNIPILYLDVGTHKEAKELSLMVNKILPRFSNNFQAYGFEASKELFNFAKEKFKNKKNITLIQAALCQTPPKDGKICLYKDSREGFANSLFREQYSEHEYVKALRLSDWLKEEDIKLSRKISLLRMNIEGAEYDVVLDLVNNGVAKHIDGYYGMWDDVSKNSVELDKKFRTFLRNNGVFPFTFNGRDFVSCLRLKCIEYDISTTIRDGFRRLLLNGSHLNFEND